MPLKISTELRVKGWRFYQFSDTDGCRLMCAWDTQPETVEALTADIVALCSA